MKNPISDVLSNKKLTYLAKRMLLLTDKEIDELFFSMNWVVSDHESYLKSLREEDLKQIRSSLKGARTKIADLVNDGGESEREIKENLSEFKKNLLKIEEK